MGGSIVPLPLEGLSASKLAEGRDRVDGVAVPGDLAVGKVPYAEAVENDPVE